MTIKEQVKKLRIDSGAGNFFPVDLIQVAEYLGYKIKVHQIQLDYK